MPLRERTWAALRALAALFVDTAAASAAMTISQHLEMRLTGRLPSEAPVVTIERLTRLSIPPGPPRVIVGHLSQGSLALVAVVAARTTNRNVVLATLVEGAALVASDSLVALATRADPPPWRWTLQETLTDLTHKTALAAAATFLSRRRARHQQGPRVARS